MGRRVWIAAALIAAVVLVAGALGLRWLLVAGFSADFPHLSWPGRQTASPTQTSTPSVQVRVVPGASATPSLAVPQPSPGATASPSHVWLPLVQSGQSLPAEGQLTPEARPTATPTPPPTAQPTSSPQPTPTPAPTRGPQRQTKLGVGLYDSGGAYLPALDQLRPSVILLMDPKEDFAREVRRMFPKAFIVGRIYVQDQPLDNPGPQGTAFADRVAQLAVPLKGVVDAWVSYNEITGHDDYRNYQAYNTFQVAFAHRLQGYYGIAAVAGNDGPGTVEPQDYVKYFAEAIRTSKYFGIHTYSPAGETSMRSQRSLDLVLRHRQVKAALDAAGIPSGPFIITESGLWDGWRGVTSDDSMASDYIWYADELNKDSYVLGTTIFGLFGTDRWQNFNVANSSIVQKIGAYNTEGWR